MAAIAQASEPHPGGVLRRKLASLNVRPAAAARHLGLSRQTLHEVLACSQSITPRVALRVAKLTGTNPETWLRMQNAFDLAVARLAEEEFLNKVPVLEDRW